MALVLDATVGGPSSNSYATVVQGDDYAASRLLSNVWTSASITNKAAALVWATRMLDTSMKWNGYNASYTQALRWPRAFCFDADNKLIRNDVIPPQVIAATCELARLLLAGDRGAETGREGIGKISLGSIAIDFDKTDAPKPIPDAVYQLVAFLGSIIQVNTRGGVMSVGLVRA